METTINVLSIIFNCFLLYLIKNYSTFGVKLYQYLLTIDAVLDLFLGIFTLLGQPIALTGDGYLVVHSNGFFAGRSAFWDSVFLFLFFFILHTNVLWIAVQFVYRYRLLCKHSARATLVNFMIIAITIGYSIIALADIIDYCQVREEYQSVAEYVMGLNNWPKPKEGSRRLYFVIYIKEWRMFRWLSLWTVTCCATIFVVILCEKKIAKNVRRHGNPTHSTTQRMHTEFHRALLAMAICPLITTTFPVFYFITTTGLSLCPGQISALMTIGLSSITLFNPLTTIACFRCYRQIAIRIVTCGRYDSQNREATVSTQQKVFSVQPQLLHSQQAVTSKSGTSSTNRPAIC
ncbi:serpentine type 7TM GPCR chemoreceptor str domain-containing protein [Ditylenchus destructor]|uniref:Serpentine type 7TM GPCR chemoreceptor str domain-containing protein n=1 Tax=Ditylenchus destructor TaxID=166010 RepID=A0AAD4MET3_9BILA|nr:serpentine type 7TM GPCR chemoreceptor str domain-containing protein [Ditylenchus destructor]